jgi:hypothetical protein
MKKLILRLLVVILSYYVAGTIVPLFASEGGHTKPSTTPAAPPPPPPAIAGGTAQLDNKLGPSQGVFPPPLGGGGCGGGGCGSSGVAESPVKPEPEAEDTTKAEEKTPEQPPKKGQVYAGHGLGAAEDEGSEKALEDTFGKDSITHGKRPTKQQLLENIPKSEVVILNSHGYDTTKTIREETGEDIPGIDTNGTPEGRLYPTDLVRSIREAKTAPKVTFLNVCALANKKNPKQLGFADALGVTPTTPKRAVIGYKTTVIGPEADHLSSETVKEWKKGGTLKEALERAKATVRSQPRPPVSKVVKAGYAPDEVVLIGDGNIKFSDLTGSPAKVGR